MVTDRFALLLGSGAGDELAAAVWAAMSPADAAFEDVLSVIAAVGIGNLPDFALVELVDTASSSVSVAVRGATTIDLHGSRRSSYAGAGVGTWVEGSAQHVAGITLALPAWTSAPVLPLGRGIARADALEWGTTAPGPSPVAGDAADAAPLETVSIDRSALAEALGPRRGRSTRSATAAVSAAAAADPRGDAAEAEASHAPTDTAPEPEADAASEAASEIDDSTVLGSRRPPAATAVRAAPPARRYVLRVATVGEVPLDQPVVLGRSPRSGRHPGARVVAVPSPRKEVSSTHVELRLDGDRLRVRDLGSTNGTIVRDASGDVALLRGESDAHVSPGAVLDLGDGVTVAFESTP